MKDYSFKINGNYYDVAISEVNSSGAEVKVNGKPYSVEFANAGGVSSKPAAVIPAQVKTQSRAVTPATQAAPAPKPTASTDGGATIKSPLPGAVLDIRVSVGDSVKVGDTLVVLEAMKMENNIDADRAGVVTAIEVEIGNTVLEGEALVRIG